MDSDLPEVLRSVLCQRLTPAEAGELAANMVPFEAPAGRFVIHEGEPSTGLFILFRARPRSSSKRPTGRAGRSPR